MWYIGIIIALILLFVWIQQVEHFTDVIYSSVPQYSKKLSNCHALKGNNWHTRFPYMVNQRYSYNDVPKACFPSMNGYANLVELLPGNTRYEKGKIYGYDYHDYYDNSFSEDKL